MIKNKIIVVLVGIIIVLAIIILFPKDKTPKENIIQSKTNVEQINTDKINTINNVQNLEKPTEEDLSYMFINPESYAAKSNIVGYFDHGTLVTYIPKWLEGYWVINNLDKEENTVMITPAKDALNNRDFTDIVMTFEKSDETYNAEYLYNVAKNNMNNDSTSEILLNNAQDTTIYHVTNSTPLSYDDYYYIDGNNGKTVTITFSASRKNYFKYASSVKTFIQGLGKGLPRG